MVCIVPYYDKWLLHELAEVHLCETLYVKISDSGDGLYCQLGLDYDVDGFLVNH